MSDNTNESKPKKIITAEQRERMNAGRKRAMEERKKRKKPRKNNLRKKWRLWKEKKRKN